MPYEVLKERDLAGNLMPDEQDYLDLQMSLEEAHSFVVRVSQEAPALVEQARRAAGTEVGGVIAGRLGVGVVVEVVVIAGEDESLEEIWVGFEMPPLEGSTELPPQPEWIMAVLAVMVPVNISGEALDFGGTFPRVGSKPNEIVVCWRSFWI